MRKSLALLVLLAMTLGVSISSHAFTVKIGSGKIRGVEEGSAYVFKGIPYAAPPVGNNRWREPQPVAPWEGIRDTAEYGADCAQAPFPPDAAPIRTTPSEDCLFLNVWKPKTGENLPVMVWIHGGGFVNGGGSPAIYTGERFARDGVVFVGINYRLGRYGFFAHEALREEGFGGNFGFLDQIAALKWVQENIAAFGGNPSNVTVFGESAGGMSMHMLLQSPLARGLFDKVIIQSGGGRLRFPPLPTMARAVAIGNAFAPGLSASELRAMPEKDVTADLNLMTMKKPGYSGPIIDGKTLLGSAYDAASAGIYRDVPLIIGANSADGFPSGADKDAIFAAFGDREDEARQLYDPDNSLSAAVAELLVSADRDMIEPARAIARTLADRQPVWLYRFDYTSPMLKNAVGMEFPGAPHASEIPYAFDTVDLRHNMALVDEEKPVAAAMHRYWVNFARTGNPNGQGLTRWPEATPDTNTVQIIDGNGGRHADDPLQQRLDFAEKLAGNP